MNPEWFGDSYDIVKRFFASSLLDLNYDVYIDPMITGEWGGDLDTLYDFLKMRPLSEYRDSDSALFLDPDTGIGRSNSSKHTTISKIVEHLATHKIVFSFDMSFSRGSEPLAQMGKKLKTLVDHGAFGFYFDSHARFLFASNDEQRLASLQRHLKYIGLPESRFVGLSGT